MNLVPLNATNGIILSSHRGKLGQLLLDLFFSLRLFFWKDAYFFEVKVNGVRKVHVKNNNPQHFTNVKVFAGDYHEPADAYIRFFYACQIKGLL